MNTFTKILRGACLAATLHLCEAADSNTAPDKAKKGERPERPKLTQEQRQLRKEILAKYDKNQDKKLDREERAKFSDDDKEKLKKAGLAPRQGKRNPATPGKKAPKEAESK